MIKNSICIIDNEFVLVISNNIILSIWIHIVNVGFVDVSMKRIASKMNVNVVVIFIYDLVLKQMEKNVTKNYNLISID